VRLAEKQNHLALLVRSVWGDNAVEFLVGAVASVVSEEQLDALIETLDHCARSGCLPSSYFPK